MGVVVWLPWGRGLSPGPRVAAVGAWPVPWASCGHLGAWPVDWVSWGCRGGVAGPLGFVGLPWWRGRSPGLRGAAVGAWPVTYASCGRHGGVSGPLRSYGRRGAHMTIIGMWLTTTWKLDLYPIA